MIKNQILAGQAGSISIVHVYIRKIIDGCWQNILITCKRESYRIHYKYFHNSPFFLFSLKNQDLKINFFLYTRKVFKKKILQLTTNYSLVYILHVLHVPGTAVQYGESQYLLCRTCTRVDLIVKLIYILNRFQTSEQLTSTK